MVEGPDLIRIVLDEAALADDRALAALRTLVDREFDELPVLRWQSDSGIWQVDPVAG